MSAALERFPTAFFKAFALSAADGLRGGAGTGLGSLSLLTFLALDNLFLSAAFLAALLALAASFLAFASFFAFLAALLAALAARLLALAALLAAFCAAVSFLLSFFFFLST